MIPFVPAYLVALGPFLPLVLISVTTGLIWLAMWLLAKGGWRAWIGAALFAAVLLEAWQLGANG